MMSSDLRIAFVSSCFNEQDNIETLYRRCLDAVDSLAGDPAVTVDGEIRRLRFSMTLADNASTDATVERLIGLREGDGRVRVLLNARNYGPEPSLLHALASTEADVYVLLCSDLQDPPELVAPMLRRLFEAGPGCDAVLACKRSTRQGWLVGWGRSLYYRALGWGTRRTTVPAGFHGFGVYRAAPIQEAVALWRETPWSFRRALMQVLVGPQLLEYDKPRRQHGRSSYSLMGYVREAFDAIFSGEAITTRLTMRLGLVALAGATLIGLAVLANVLGGRSGYSAGTPTIMLLVLASLGIQSMLLAMLSYQIENLQLASKRPRVRSRLLAASGEEQ